MESCKGTAIYCHLLRQSAWRALFHFLLLCFLTVLTVWLFMIPPINRQIDAAYARIAESCGQVTLTDAGLLPEKDPTVNRMIFSMPRLELTYVGNIEAELPKIDIGLADSGIIWMPKSVLVWAQRDQDSYLLYTIANGELLKMQTCPREQIAEFIKAAYQATIQEKIDVMSPTLNLFLYPKVVKISMALGSFVGLLGMMIFQFMFFILMVSLIFSALGSRRLQGKLFFRDYFVLNCYIAFPCILISAVWLAFRLPLLNFQWVSILSFSIYFMIVMSRIERWLSPAPPENESGD
jgi:hypothetical protein